MPAGTPGGAKSLTVTATDTAQNTASGTITLAVNTSTSPSGSGSAAPSTVTIGQSTALTVNVTPGTHPASTGLTVTGDLSLIGGSATQAFQGSGNTFTFSATPTAIPSGGSVNLHMTISDAQGRSGSTTIPLTVTSSAPSVVSTTPAGNATGVLVGSSVVVTFNKSVNATTSAFAIQCPPGSPQTFTQSDSPNTSFTLTPAAPLPGNTTCTVTVASSQVTDAQTATPMASDVQFSFHTAPAAAGRILINEIDADTPGSDTAEFIELSGPPSTPLDGLVVVLYDGGLSPFTGNQSYAAFDLSGYSTDVNGYFVLGNPSVPNAQLTFDPGQFGLLQNGPDAVALYIGHASDFPNGTTVTTTNVLDAIVYGTDDPAPVNLLPLVKSGQLIVNEDANGNGANESIQRCPNAAGAARDNSAYIAAAPTPGAANACPAQAPPSSIVISQVYGGGGNSASSPYHNDFVELYNRGAAPVDVTQWSLQYASATGSGWAGELQPLGGTINPGEYYLISLASGGSNGAPLPSPNVSSPINISVSSGKIALVDNLTPLVGNCPLTNPHVRDFAGYGTTADCAEGDSATPAPSTTTAVFRAGSGSVDTNNNFNDFAAGAPLPRRTAQIVEIGPYVFFTDPLPNAMTVPRDATIEVDFTQPVDVTGSWFDITCAVTGHHNDATFGGTTTDRYITPNVNFQAGELCAVTIFKSQIQETSDPTETLPSDYTFSFTVASGAAPPESPDVHLLMGNPTGAVADESQAANYLMSKPEYALSYNRDLGRPNWVSWHLTQAWIPSSHPSRVDTFRADPQVPPAWYRVESFDFSGSGFDRGHMSPNADRESSTPVNQATFLMSNMIAQAPANNQGPWADFENYLRTVVNGEGDPTHPNEIYIVSGPWGTGGAGSNGAASTVAGSHVTVPAFTWKVALVLPDDGAEDDVPRVTCSTRTIAVILPNDQTTSGKTWQTYLTTVSAVETLTGYQFFSNVPAPIQGCIKAGTNGVNPKIDQTITFGALADRAFGDGDVQLTATASSGLTVTYTVSGPATLVNGNALHLTGLGPVSVTARQAGDVNYNAAPDVTQTFTIVKATPSFSGLSTPSIEVGTANTTVSGTIAGAGGFVPSGAVTITLGGTSLPAAINSATGAFSVSFATGGLSLANSPYQIAFSYPGDPDFNAVSAATTLTVVDTTAPSIGQVSVTPDTLGPPNHKMIDVLVSYVVTDAGGPAVCSLSVASNEPVNGAGDGNTTTDWFIVDAHHVQLRDERAGTGDGRIYTIAIGCADRSGNRSTAAATVRVRK